MEQINQRDNYSERIFFSVPDLNEKGFMVWENGRWRAYLRTDGRYQSALWLENIGYNSILEHFGLDHGRLRVEQVFNIGPEKLKELSGKIQ